jgi:hypothetical protein
MKYAELPLVLTPDNEFDRNNLKSNYQLLTELPKELAATCQKDGTRTNTQDGTGIRTTRQMRHRPTKTKTERPIASPGLSFCRTGRRCPIPVCIHGDGDDDHYDDCDGDDDDDDVVVI